VLGLTLEQWLILVGVGIALLVLLFLLRTVLRITRTLLRLGCFGIIIAVAVIFTLMQGFGK
jgi:hypothetical protein